MGFEIGSLIVETECGDIAIRLGGKEIVLDLELASEMAHEILKLVAAESLARIAHLEAERRAA